MVCKNEAKNISSIKILINSLAKDKVNAPSVSFSAVHLFYILEFLSKNSLGRSRLAYQLAVGEGAIRTIISRLVKAGLVTTSSIGCTLTVEGIHVWQQLEGNFPRRIEFLRTNLTPCVYNFAFLVKGCSDKVGSGIVQRDMAVFAGAVYAVILIFRNGRLSIKSISEDVQELCPEAVNQIIQNLEPLDGDVVVIAGGETALEAKFGAFAASWSLIDDEVIENKARFNN